MIALADRVKRALAEVGGDRTWELDSASDPDDPRFTVICHLDTPVSEEAWTLLWQAFGVAGGAGGGWKVPCLACYLKGDAYADYVAGIDRCEQGWPSPDCGRERGTP